GMLKPGHNRDEQLCCMKAKELRQARQWLREGNNKSGATLQTCHFCNKLHARLSVDPPPHTTVDTLQEPDIDTSAVHNEEEEEGGKN
ncbi:hypothetical protein KIL84_017453, partial [Mauremys mutica]